MLAHIAHINITVISRHSSGLFSHRSSTYVQHGRSFFIYSLSNFCRSLSCLVLVFSLLASCAARFGSRISVLCLVFSSAFIFHFHFHFLHFHVLFLSFIMGPGDRLLFFSLDALLNTPSSSSSLRLTSRTVFPSFARTDTGINPRRQLFKRSVCNLLSSLWSFLFRVYTCSALCLIHCFFSLTSLFPSISHRPLTGHL